MMDSSQDRRLSGPTLVLLLTLTIAAAGCGKKDEPAATGAAAPPATPAAEGAGPATPPDSAQPTAMQQETPKSWTPEALEELLAPIALYPDAVLSQVLIASTNPQEVLDAGNWLLQNQALKGNALDEAAIKVGFTPPMRALIQFPETVDMMCMQLDWTSELGEAFVADQEGVLDAVQRLRKQAKDVGNLQSSEQMKVETKVENGDEVVALTPAKPEVIYVPQYDPQAVYAPPPAAAAPAATTTTTTEEKGHSTGSLVATGLLAFGAGMLVNEVFDDDDDDHWHDDYWHGGMPYYPPYPYRPPYGGGYYPANGYNRPPNYQHGFNNNNIVVINNGQNNYWNDRKQRQSGYQRTGAYQAKSPISTARPNRPELQQLNQRQPKPMPADARRPSSTTTRDNYRSQSSYAGARQGSASATRPTTAPATGAKGARPAKVQGSYAGATPERAKAASTGGYDRQGGGTREQPKAQPASRDMQQPRGDRGYAGASQQPRPQKSQQPQPINRPSPQNTGGGGGSDRGSAVAGANRGGNADRAASQRGKQSMPQGARSKGGGGKQRQGR
jgi:hypothetical protein